MNHKVMLPKTVSILDLSMGLCLVAGRHDMKQPEIRAMHEALQKFDHDTLFPAAVAVAEKNGRQLAVEIMTFQQLVNNGTPDCMMFNRIGDKAVCACLCGGELVCPNGDMAPEPDQKVVVILPVNQLLSVLQA
jgi:hypothetical protein